MSLTPRITQKDKMGFHQPKSRERITIKTRPTTYHRACLSLASKKSNSLSGMILLQDFYEVKIHSIQTTTFQGTGPYTDHMRASWALHKGPHCNHSTAGEIRNSVCFPSSSVPCLELNAVCEEDNLFSSMEHPVRGVQLLKDIH